jgi:hypothetical protein
MLIPLSNITNSSRKSHTMLVNTITQDHVGNLQEDTGVFLERSRLVVKVLRIFNSLIC